MASFVRVCGRSSSLLLTRSVRLQFAKLLAAASGSESTDVVTHTGQVFLLDFQCCYVTKLEECHAPFHRLADSTV